MYYWLFYRSNYYLTNVSLLILIAIGNFFLEQNNFCRKSGIKFIKTSY